MTAKVQAQPASSRATATLAVAGFSPSCGNQPAHISLTARRTDTLTKINKRAEEQPKAVPRTQRRDRLRMPS
jgi:hypothetical protein